MNVEEWVHKCGKAIASRHGVLLKECLAAAESGEVVQLTSDHPAALESLVLNVKQTLTDATATYAARHPQPYTPAPSAGGRQGRGQGPTPRHPQPQHHHRHRAAEEREREGYIQTVLRVAITGALARYQQIQQQQQAPSSPAASSTALYHNTLARGLLHAFEAFREVHAMDRDFYPHPGRLRGSNYTTVGTVGWDTIVLLHFVHRIPHLMRHAEGEGIDEAVGAAVRGWRRLLVELQTADPLQPPADSRRRGMLSLVNGLLMMLFQRFNTHQCAALLAAVDHAEQQSQHLAPDDTSSRSVLRPSAHMTSEVITYHYYVGRMRLYEQRLEEAHRALREAYTLLPAPGAPSTGPQHRNKQRVRFFLAVAGVACGWQVPDAILDADDFIQLSLGLLVRAMQRGDAVAYEAALDAYSSIYRRRGVFLILQRAKVLCFLLLVARVHAAMAALPGVDNSRITLTTLVRAYNEAVAEGHALAAAATGDAPYASPTTPTPTEKTTSGKESASVSRRRPREETAGAAAAALEAMDDDRMVLWVAKLITLGHVRGYISHEHKTVVLSKADPFPRLHRRQV